MKTLHRRSLLRLLPLAVAFLVSAFASALATAASSAASAASPSGASSGIGSTAASASATSRVSPPAARAPRIVLVHPTRANLDTFFWLVQHRIFAIPAPEVVGVYHESETYDYASARAFAQEHPEHRISFVALDGALDDAHLFERNACTDAFRTVWQGADALIFWGGPDIQPAIYGEKTSLLTDITDPGRHRFEVSFLFHLLGGSRNEAWRAWLEERPDTVLLGFCLGMQSMNVATGGTLIQDLPTEVYGIGAVEELLAAPQDRVHRNYWRHLTPDDTLIGGSPHRIRVLQDGFFAKEMGFDAKRTPVVYSSHHQAVEKPGRGFAVVATSMDGKIVEAIHHTKFRNVLGVQFHPEPTVLYGGPRTKKTAPADASPVDFQKLLADGDGAGTEFHRAYWEFFAKLLRR